MYADTLDEEISIIWKFILNEDYTDFKIKKESRKKLLDSIILYYKIHFPDFYTPKSLPVLVQIFE
jgi:DNA repair protein RecO (recombination protein O)